MAGPVVLSASPLVRSGGRQAAVSGRPGFDASVEVVRLHAAVLEAGGEPLTGLTAEDFVIIDNGAERRVAFALTPGDAPIDVALVFDQSESIRQGAPTVKRDARAFLDALDPRDCAFVLPFQHRIGPGIWGVSVDPGVLQTIDLTPLEGGTSFYDALLVGLFEVQRWNVPDILSDSIMTDYEQPQIDGGVGIGPPVGAASAAAQPAEPKAIGFTRADLPFRRFDAGAGCDDRQAEKAGAAGPVERRRALVVLTDGVDTTSAHSFGELLGLVRQTEVPVFVVVVGHPVGGRRNREAERVARIAEGRLRTIAEASGGKLVDGSGSAEKLQEAYEEIVTILRGSYLLGYYPEQGGADDGGETHRHEVEVKVRRNGAKIFARSDHYRGDGALGTARTTLRRGVDSFLDRRLDEASALAKQVVALDSELWDGHFLEAAIHWSAGRSALARDAVARSLWLEPGVAASHQLAWQLDYDAGDDDAAWQQAIRAHVAGADMDDEIRLLAARSVPPDGLESSLRAPRLFVEGPRGDDPAVYARLAEVTRSVARSVSGSPLLGLVRSPLAADYFVYLEAEDADRRRPRRLEAKLELYNYIDRRMWREDLDLDDLEDVDVIDSGVGAVIDKLEEWLARRR